MNFACAVLGIGSLAMGRNFGRTGILPGSFALWFMFAINAFSTMALSKIMLAAPRHVRTYGDLGAHIGGTAGRYIVVILQFGSCIVLPIAFLVLGGATLLPLIFREYPQLTANHYICFMAISLMPFVLLRTLKEATWAAVLGTLGSAVGDLAAVFDSEMNSEALSNVAPICSTDTLLGVFGSLAMSFGGAVIVPAIQREHPQPERMPTIIFVVFFLITLCYWVIGLQGYMHFGCMAPDNLLLSSSTRPAEVIAMVSFMVHIVIAFAVYLNPAFFLFERKFLGLHQIPAPVEDAYANLTKTTSPVVRKSLVSVDETALEPWTMQERLKSYALRTTVVAMQVFVALLAQNCFADLADFAGATCVAFSGIVVPLLMYWKFYQRELGWPVKALIVAIVLISSALSVYTSYLYMKQIVNKFGEYELFTSDPPTNLKLTNEFCLVK